MKYDSKTYEINYNECDKEYIDNLIVYFNKEKDNIFKFFDLNNLSKKLIINIYDDINKYTEYRNNNISDTSIGNMDFDDNNYYLNILSYKEIIKRKGHTNDTITYMYKTIIHELVHICHEENGTYNNSLIWVKEGIAIVLSKQYEGLDYKINNCSLEDLINNRRTWYINYYTLMDYALKKYGNDYIKRLVIDSNFSKEETSKIYNEVLKSIN